MKIDILSLFPDMFVGPFGHSIIKRAQEAGLLTINVTNPRDFTTDKHKIVDDYPFGGGSGMVMKPEPIFRAVENVLSGGSANRLIVLMCPGGTPFNQDKAKQFANYEQLVLICGHYEGIDERVRQYLIDEAISIGDYVLTGGELPAMVVVDAVARMLPGVLGACDAAAYDSFYNGLLEYPQYTRPRDFNGLAVPEILLSGDHAKIERWRRKQSLKNTLERRPDLFDKIKLNSNDAKLLAEILAEENTGG
ncbi:MAG TPA: tRNA (guanosine(37)-N1)-methyltransferase TrmD [Methylomusa anaerophila]|uniref:tRNA (guanine-N(1)-)-methyltransferase n=1 Tax=Methylomusa anaerophila TaxID=1930071 RepID=A0A348AQ67_9FIRM|nr:tRNA (guanosine(37)-N1)-methyltransferase TrmD [Methylomusa anaerophila]BBB93215.1 tRNA (guanine-N(1)-)-methyltransferase [Methylomusa anaerophila]HML86953.1 tRNA (guanosine(37)-N1)-methyltransferase TrmD [Methylomusa anaerophila]